MRIVMMAAEKGLADSLLLQMNMTDMAASGSGGDMRIPLGQCRKIFVQRDYSRGLAVRFMSDFPEEIQDKVCFSVNREKD